MNKPSSPSVLLIGAYERDNFGDLLFLKIFQKVLSNYSLIPGSLVTADLTAIGGDQVVAVDSLDLDACNLRAIIHCGGETLACDKKTALVMDLDNDFYAKNKNEFQQHAEAVLGNLFVGNNRLGYVCGQEDLQLKESVPVGFISVGGSDSSAFTTVGLMQQHLQQRLKKAACVIVRDEVTQKNLTRLEIHPLVYPDIVHLISQTHADEIVQMTKSESFAEIRDLEPYIVFQCNHAYVGQHTALKIAQQLIAIAEKHQRSIVIQPSGLANGHDSLVSLQQIASCIAEKSHIRVLLQADRNIWKQVAVLANSSCNISTSLHVLIVSSSFSVPCIALENLKVANYFRAWKMTEHQADVRLADLATAFTNILAINNARLQKQNDALRAQALLGVQKLLQDLKLDSNFHWDLISQELLFENKAIFLSATLQQLRRFQEKIIELTLTAEQSLVKNKQLDAQIETLHLESRQSIEKLQALQDKNRQSIEKIQTLQDENRQSTEKLQESLAYKEKWKIAETELQELKAKNRDLQNQVVESLQRVAAVQSRLQMITSSQFFKLWQLYCRSKDFLFRKNKR